MLSHTQNPTPTRGTQPTDAILAIIHAAEVFDGTRKHPTFLTKGEQTFASRLEALAVG
jgi:hypothetical protein